ncbi:TPA: hypothetical protein DDW35_04160, partial [Candidatus Sumerlaeota bacterium]|nr:hypothetical protein [Candidatus Sumerlaeota bacterium]
LTGPITFLAEAAVKNVSVGGARWEKILDYGRGPSAMEVFPVTTAPIQPPNLAPCLEYPVYFARAGKFDVELITAPTLDTIPGRGLGIAVSIDNQVPQVVNVFTPETYKDETPHFGKNYHKNVSDNARVMRFAQTIDKPGKHTLKITMVDPTVAVQKVIIHDTKLPNSYFGPLENKLNDTAHWFQIL